MGFILIFTNALVMLIPPLLPEDLKYKAGKPLTLGLKVFILGITLWIGLQIYDLIKKVRSDPGHLGRLAFVEAYSQSLNRAIKVIQDLPDHKKKGRLKEAQESILQIICSVIEVFLEDREDDDLKINANLMLGVPTKDKRKEDFPGLHFIDPQRNLGSYRAVLVTTNCAYEDTQIPDDFALPVDNDRGRVLFGAPAAYVHNEMQVIGDIKNVKRILRLVNDHPRVVKNEIKAYCESDLSFESFASWCLLGKNNERLGVLNVQSNKRDIVGPRNDHRLEIDRLIAPFRSILALSLIAEEEPEEPAKLSGAPSPGEPPTQTTSASI